MDFFYNIRMLEEPFPEYSFCAKKSGKKENSSSSSSSLPGYSFGTVLEEYWIDSNYEEEAQRMFVNQ